MPAPIFLPSLIKKYVVQTRSVQISWQEYDSFKNLAQAKQAAQKLKQQNPALEVRIFNRLTKQALQTFTTAPKDSPG